MRIGVHVVGRMKAGPEKELADRFFDRFAKSGPSVGLEFSGVLEIVEGRARETAERRADEAGRLLAQMPPGAALILLDERGKNITSEDFANQIAALRDGGRKATAIAIGGPDGLDPSLRSQAALTLSFGALTWPHQLVRVMLAEQLYRATTILSGHPYHRA
jgi:23S rRNA (pseudouridine1915-N3)-methyltransferase